MKILLEFIECKDLSKNDLFASLKCSLDEALVLQKVASSYIEGEDELVVLDLLRSIHKPRYAYLEHIVDIKRLLELGWIHQQSFNPIKVSEATPLELLNSTIAPSSGFLRLLQGGEVESELADIKPYRDHLEYLQDQFMRVELYQKMSSIRQNVHEHSLGIDRAMKRLSTLEKRIEQRVKQTSAKFELERFLKQKKLSAKEQVIFLALLKEEYSSTDAMLREMNTLIDLVSSDEYDRIKNRSLLEEGSHLIKEGIIDYEEVLNPFGGISRSFYIVDDLLQSLIHPQKTKKTKRIKLDSVIDEQDIFELVEPTTSLEDVVLESRTEEMLRSLLRQLDKDVINRLVEWGIKDKKSGIDARIIFYGSAGTGKTITAYSLAKSLKKEVLAFDCSKILSMYVGESEKNVRKIFDTYYDLAHKTKSEPVLLLNEADQFLSTRSVGAMSGSEQMYNQMQNIFLEQIEKFDGILIATTNLLENIDKAFSRRFNYKIEFKRPSRDQRLKLWKKMLPKNAKFKRGFKVDRLAEFDLSGAQIQLVVKNSAYKVAIREDSIFSEEDFLEEIERERLSSFDSQKAMGFLI